MAVVTSTELIQIARKNGWLLPAYNTTNMEMTLGILDGLQRAGMPGILQIAPTNVKLSDYGMIASIVISLIAVVLAFMLVYVTYSDEPAKAKK